MAEALLRQKGGDAFEVHSAGTEPRGINPLTLRVLAEAGIDASWARSKSVDEYLGQSFDYVVTVCDEARQACPVFPGVHESLHWGYEDPAEAAGHRGGTPGGLPAGLHPARRADPPVRDRPTAQRASRQPADLALPVAPRPRRGSGRWDGPDAARPLTDKGRTQRTGSGGSWRVGFRTDADHHLAQAAGGPDRGDRRHASGSPSVRMTAWPARSASSASRPSCAMPATLLGRSSSVTTRTSATSSRCCAAPPTPRCARARSPGSRPIVPSARRRDAALADAAGRPETGPLAPRRPFVAEWSVTFSRHASYTW